MALYVELCVPRVRPSSMPRNLAGAPAVVALAVAFPGAFKTKLQVFPVVFFPVRQYHQSLGKNRLIVVAAIDVVIHDPVVVSGIVFLVVTMMMPRSVEASHPAEEASSFPPAFSPAGAPALRSRGRRFFSPPPRSDPIAEGTRRVAIVVGRRGRARPGGRPKGLAAAPVTRRRRRRRVIGEGFDGRVRRMAGRKGPPHGKLCMRLCVRFFFPFKFCEDEQESRAAPCKHYANNNK